MVYILYTDNSIIAGSDKAAIEETIEQIKQSGLDITIEGDIRDFLGINITLQQNQFHLTQPKLIQSILCNLNLTNDDVKPKDIPMALSQILHQH